MAVSVQRKPMVVVGRVFSPPSQGEVLDPHRVVKEIRKAKGDASARYLEAPEEILAHCVEEAASGDVILVMSSGHFEGLPGRIYTALRDHV